MMLFSCFRDIIVAFTLDTSCSHFVTTCLHDTGATCTADVLESHESIVFDNAICSGLIVSVPRREPIPMSNNPTPA